ncbi:MAG: S8 family serine peptidase [Candidatus Cybelea sp.]
MRLVMVLVVTACSENGNSSGLPGAPGRSPSGAQIARNTKLLWGPNVVAVCPHARPGNAQCLALLRTDIAPSMHPASLEGLTPADFQSAYDLPSSKKGAGQIVAIVDAYDNPNVASDLSTYRSEFDLLPANFTKYNQNGQRKKYPSPNTTWGLEEDLDVQMVSASCPNCTIYLVEANSNSALNLEAAESEAVKLGAHIVSNSWICDGSIYCYSPSYFDTPGVTYLAAAGDDGYGTGAPMALASVVAVGGTTLSKSSGKRGWTESVWGGTGSGCASGVKKPSWQHDPDCSYRMANDVAADADPGTGAAIYDTFGNGGWLVEGGTSLSSPLIAGVFALAGNATKQDGGQTFWEKNHEGTGDLYRITRGDNGSCSPNYYCTDGTHEYKDYGGPTGWGTPHGTGAF